jgi:hypothetical protein
MKASILSLMVFLLTSWFGNVLQAQFDDLYFDRSKDMAIVGGKGGQTEIERTDERSVVAEEYDDESENFDEYSYSSRIRRFHNPVVNQYYFNSFDNWWNLPGQGFMPGSFISMGSGFNNGFGFSPWNRPWNNWGWNSWSPWYSPWSNNWMGFSGYGNNIFLMQNFYGNGWNYGGWNQWNNWNNWNHGGWNHWNNGGWNGGFEPVNKIYGSRKTGSTSSSVNGRDASPRRPVVSGGNGEDRQVQQTDQRDSRDVQSERRTERNTGNQRRIFQGSQDNSSPAETRDTKSNSSREAGPVRETRTPQRESAPQQRTIRENRRGGGEDNSYRPSMDNNNSRSSWDSGSRSSSPSGNSNFGGSSGRSSGGSSSRRGG